MPDPISLVLFAAILFGLSLTPGPAAAFCVAVGLEDHDRNALWAPVGVTLGKLAHLSLAAVGATWINELPAVARNVILLAAGSYLIWQGFRYWSQRIALMDHHGERRGPRALHVVVDGFLVSVANPESLASAVAVLPLFVDPATTARELSVLIAVGTVAVLGAYVLYESIAVLLAHRLSRRSQNRLVGATYLAAAAGLAVLVLV